MRDDLRPVGLQDLFLALRHQVDVELRHARLDDAPPLPPAPSREFLPPRLLLRGVEHVESGYIGGTLPHPSYEAVCTGTTGHAEVVQVTYDPAEISYREVLDVFFTIHDPTTLNRQGNDVGTQYRSVILYHTDEQKELAEHYKRKLDESGIYSRPIVTEITRYSEFYPAEDYHKNYYQNNKSQGYCQVVINPKLKKVQEQFATLLK